MVILLHFPDNRISYQLAGVAVRPSLQLVLVLREYGYSHWDICDHNYVNYSISPQSQVWSLCVHGCVTRAIPFPNNQTSWTENARSRCSESLLTDSTSHASLLVIGVLRSQQLRLFCTCKPCQQLPDREWFRQAQRHLPKGVETVYDTPNGELRLFTGHWLLFGFR